MQLNFQLNSCQVMSDGAEKQQEIPLSLLHIGLSIHVINIYKCKICILTHSEHKRESLMDLK